MKVFIEARERVQRAQMHMRTLGDLWNTFLEDEPYTPRVHVKDDGTGSVWVFPHYNPIPPEFSLELGEMLYQLRAALDNCIYQAAVYDTESDPPPSAGDLAFPICHDREGFERLKWKIKPLADQRQAIVKSVQPFKANTAIPGVRAICENLPILNDWARKDRHRKLHVVGSWSSEASPILEVPQEVTVDSMEVSPGSFLEDESRIATFTLSGWKPGMDIRANPNNIIDIAIKENPLPKRSSDTLPARIDGLFHAVQGVRALLEKSYSARSR